MPSATYEQISLLPLTAEHVVGPEHLDVNGHMNIGHYFAFGGHAMWDRNRQDLGMPDSYIAERGLTTFTAEQHLCYLAEAVAGDEIGVHTVAVDAGPKAIHMAALITNRTHGRLACVMESIAVHVDFGTRRPVPFPDDVAALIAAAIEGDCVDIELPLSGAIAIRR